MSLDRRVDVADAVRAGALGKRSQAGALRPTSTASSSTDSPSSRPLEGPSLAGMRLLIVEDDRDSREMLCELLRRHGAQCWSAEDVPTARQALSEVAPDVVLSDIGLPGEDGYALLRWIRGRISSTPTPPVIAVSAYDLRDWHAFGFEAHIRKPIETALLLQALLDVVNARATRFEKR